MTRRYCLSYLTLELSPPVTLEVAARTGYDCVGVRLMPALSGGQAFSLMSDAAMLRETLARMADTGIPVFDVEIARIAGTTSVEAWLPMLETAGRLGASTVISAGDDPDEGRMTATFAALCEGAARFGLSVNLEFTPWTLLNSVSAATRVVTAAGQPNGEVLVDTIHVARSASSLADLRAIPAERMSYFQLCDCPGGTPGTVEEMLYTAREERLLPGEGSADLSGMIDSLPQDLIVSVEIPSHSRIAQMGAEAWARTALEASRAAMDVIDSARQKID